MATPTSAGGGQASPTVVGVQGTPTATNTPTVTPTGPTPTTAPTELVPSTGGTPGVTPTTQINITGSANYQGFNNINPQLEAVGLGILGRRANLQAGINSNNVSQLQQAWMVNTPDEVTCMPLIENGKVFFADWGGNAYAVDASNGTVIWQKNLEQPQTSWPFYGFAGTGTLGNGNYYLVSAEGKAFALDQNNGNIIWQASISTNQYTGNLSKLLFYNGKIYFGTESVEELLIRSKPGLTIDFQGSVMALDAQTGKVVWQTPMVQAPGNGVSVWGAFAIDPNTNTLFFGTGNNYTGEATQHSDSVIAVDANSGNIKWSTQVDSNDIWLPVKPIGPDFDFGSGPQLFDLQGKQLLGIGQKSGYYWAFDRNTGQPVWKTFIGDASEGGGIRANASYAQGFLFVWSNNAYKDGEDPGKYLITVKALDAATGKNIWVVNNAQPAAGLAAGFLSNDVYFVGSLDGTIKGYSAADGKVVYDNKVTGPVGGSLLVDGNTLYVGVGVPKAMGGGPGSGVIAFATGGKVQTQTAAGAQSQTPGAALSQTPTPAIGVGLTASPSPIAGGGLGGSPTPNFGLGLTPSAIAGATQATSQGLGLIPTFTPTP